MGDWLLSLVDLKVHGPIGAAMVGLIYFGRRHLQRDAREFKEVDGRVKELELDRVVRSDINRIDDKLDRLLLLMAERKR